MDAFVIAFRIPNLFRRLFGEGALTASYLPVLSAQWENNRQAARHLANVVIALLALNLTLIWPMAEAGLALATAFAAAVQLFVLMAIFSRRHAPLDWGQLSATAVRALAGASVMAGTVWVALGWMPEGVTIWGQGMRVIAAIVSGAAAYGVSYRLLGGRELGMLLGGGIEN